MSYIIDARLEQTQPQLRVIDSRNGHCRLQWSGDAVRECLARGGLCEQDFCCADPHYVEILVRTLFQLSSEVMEARAAGLPSPASACPGCQHPQCGRSWVALRLDRRQL